MIPLVIFPTGSRIFSVWANKPQESVFDTDQDMIAVFWRTNLIANEESHLANHEKASKSMDCDQAAMLCLQLRSMFPGARIISIQPATTVDEQTILAMYGVEDNWQYPIADFADTAGIIEHMDLVVSIESDWNSPDVGNWLPQ